MFHLTFRLISVAMLLAGAVPAAAQQMTVPVVADFEDPQFGVFYDHVTQRLQGRVADGALIVDSQREAGQGAIAHYFLQPGLPVSVFVDVDAALATPDSDPDGLISGAGVVIRRNNEGTPLSFYALIAQSGGYLIVGWTDSGISQRLGGAWPEDTEQPVRLAARETATGAEFFVNGEMVGALSDSAITGNGAGLVVFGGGRVVFDNFGINTLSDIGD